MSKCSVVLEIKLRDYDEQITGGIIFFPLFLISTTMTQYHIGGFRYRQVLWVERKLPQRIMQGLFK